MPTKAKPKLRVAAKVAKPLSDKQRASDEALRESLRTADLRVLDKALAKAIKPAQRP